MLLSDIFTSGRDTSETHLRFAHAEKWISHLAFDSLEGPHKKKIILKPALWMLLP